MVVATSPSYEEEAVALTVVRSKWRVKKVRIPARKGKWQKKIVNLGIICK